MRNVYVSYVYRPSEDLRLLRMCAVKRLRSIGSERTSQSERKALAATIYVSDLRCAAAGLQSRVTVRLIS